MQAIEMLGKDLTILIIAHRTSTLRLCDFVIKLHSGSIVREQNLGSLRTDIEDAKERISKGSEPLIDDSLALVAVI
jgi:ABC-type multidrug transport system fused ATPase/permease subunit